MKKSYILGAVALVAASLTSCDDFLNDNRYPLSIQTENTAYWSSAPNVQTQVNYFYEVFTGYANSSAKGEFYFPGLNDDQTSSSGGNSLAAWKNINVPTSSSTYNSPYVYIRKANLIINGVEASSLTDAQKANFTGIARLMRAYEYYMLVRCYGDVMVADENAPTSLNQSDIDALYGPRTDRKKVMDNVLTDLDYAIANIGTKAAKNAFSKDLARAIKSEVCLYEASYARYHQKDETRAVKFYGEVVKAAESLVKDYPVGPYYQAIYNSFKDALSANGEIIFMKEYVQDVFMHCTVDYTSSSTPISGITKDAFDAYLFVDGKPLALTSCDTNDAGVIDENGNLSIAAQLAVRDGRLAQTIDDVVYYTGKPYKRANSMNMTSVTGYGVKKFVNPNMSYYYTTSIYNYTCAPLFWGAYVGLNYAEAKAELGTLTDEDMTLTLNKLYERAGLPAQTVASLIAMNDPANNMGVSSLLWEVRRCRRCELIYDKDIRYWDLVRWHKLDLLDSTEHPNIALGANVANSDVEVTTTGDYINASGRQTRTFESRQYLFPIPSGQIALNPELGQNPGW